MIKKKITTVSEFAEYFELTEYTGPTRGKNKKYIKLELIIENANVDVVFNVDVLFKILKIKDYDKPEDVDLLVSLDIKSSKMKGVDLELNPHSGYLINYVFIRSSEIYFMEVKGWLNPIIIENCIIKYLKITFFSEWRECRIKKVMCDEFVVERSHDEPKLQKIYHINNLTVKRRIKIDHQLLDEFRLRYINISSATKSDLVDIRKLKLRFKEDGNTFDELNAASCEQKIVFSDLMRNTRLGESISEKVLLSLNLSSNEFGINWLRAATWTIMINVLGSFILYCSFFPGPYDYSSISPDYLKIVFGNFAPIYRIDFLEDNNANIWHYLLHFTTKILIFYGIYQTVQAFRKYRK
ncbi:hypothetical protein [Aquimarina sp. AU474]|uniref:hypothetical protein n=1 Tax=Aquimarina sp. AU474 TaxID=2108529 RepID=UPI000D68CCFB|nr:hypothetical protein [Aquimarina sp. AU474]